jgi:hypothetical protein
MKEFMLVFRRDAEAAKTRMSPQEYQTTMKLWQDWISSVTARDRLVATGKRLSMDGAVLKPKNVVTNGPYVETKEALVGYMFVNAASIAEATEIAKGCPNLTVGGTVEVRPVWSDDMN